MKELAEVFYNMFTSRGDKNVQAAALILLHMPGDNTAKGIAKRMRSIADELDKINDSQIPF